MKYNFKSNLDDFKVKEVFNRKEKFCNFIFTELYLILFDPVVSKKKDFEFKKNNSGKHFKQKFLETQIFFL